jgi:26S proteasome regulatory subunit N3
VLLLLTDAKQWAEAKEVAAATVQRLGSFNRRTLDVLAARIYHYYSLAHVRTGTLPSIRSQLLALHRTAVLRHDELGQEMLLNLLLRNHLAANLYDQAEALRSKAQRPETSRSATQAARYLYYYGRIQAVQLDYTAARDSLQQAARKAPTAAYAFRAEVNKWLALVRLLLSDVPERTELTAPGLATALAPYFHLTNAVRIGDLTAFQEVAERYRPVWARDRVVNLVVRLRQNVLRAGLARIGAAYSRISLADVAAKLGVASAADAESIVAKVIRDGGLEASIDHEAGVMVCRESADVYSTSEPAAAFHARTAFCLDIHNEAVRAMRFEEGANRRKGETEEARAERVKAEAELSAALAEADEEDGMDS